MSLFLYRLGRWVGGHRLTVIAVWVIILAALGVAFLTLGSAFEDDYSIPGTESAQGEEILADRFGSDATGATAQVLFRATDGSIDSAESEAAVDARLSELASLPGVAEVSSLDDLRESDDGSAALATVRFEDEDPEDAVMDAVRDIALQESPDVTTTVGGGAFSSGAPEAGHIAEIVGILVALAVLVFTFGSFIAAGLPIVTAVVGVGATISALSLLSLTTSITTTSPSFASMLGLAVGIDYALFILARHRSQLSAGLDPQESLGRALATAGSAVVFAGLTVIVSLAGLALAGVPVLAALGLAGALAVAVSVLVALTLVPAVAALFGRALTPSPRRRRAAGAGAGKPRITLAERWVRTITKRPAVTVAATVTLLAVMSIPAFSLTLALPDAGTRAESDSSRQHYDAVSDAFGEGFNAPLLITADVLASDDPREAVDDLEAELREFPGVVDVSMASPNAGGDTALLRVIPEGGQSDERTVALVHDLREDAPALEKASGVTDLRVTGTTAVNIDLSERLAAALLPFGLTVVGLCLILLAVIFRSVAVPIKAALGYVLSVGAAFGATVAVFGWGWMPWLSGGQEPGAVVSFLPILLMGVLFGLAMDYEMFLVSRMREHYVETGHARESVYAGFGHSAVVVAAAAVIMVAVFASFVPTGSSTLKPLAFGLAVGVFVDAFIVRMTLVPAALILLGDRAWWLPRRLGRLLPRVDVEGEAMQKVIEATAFEDRHGDVVLRAEGLCVAEHDHPLDIIARPGRVTTIPVTDAGHAARLMAAISGRTAVSAGTLVVCGATMPEQRATAVQRAAIVTTASILPRSTVGAITRDGLAWRGGTQAEKRRRRARVAQLAADPGRSTDTLDTGEKQLLAGAIALAGGARLLVFAEPPTDHVTATLLRHGATIVRFARVDAAAAPTLVLEAAR